VFQEMVLRWGDVWWWGGALFKICKVRAQKDYSEIELGAKAKRRIGAKRNFLGSDPLFNPQGEEAAAKSN